MLELEESDRLDYTRIASDATNELARMVKGSEVSPLMTPTNTHRQRLLRDMRAKLKKSNGNGVLHVSFTTKDISIGGDVSAPTARYAFRLTFERGKFQCLRVV